VAIASALRKEDSRFESQEANPTIVSYNTSVVKIYGAKKHTAFSECERQKTNGVCVSVAPLSQTQCIIYWTS
jgi:hypothetical protein